MLDIAKYFSYTNDMNTHNMTEAEYEEYSKEWEHWCSQQDTHKATTKKLDQQTAYTRQTKSRLFGLAKTAVPNTSNSRDY